MGLTASPTAAMYLDAVSLDIEHRIGAEGEGMRIALSALDSGRLGIAACATGLGQAALDVATAYAQERKQFGSAIAEFQGVQFLLADMAAAVASARATYVMRRASGMPGRRSPQTLGREADRHRRRDEGDHRRGPGPRRVWLHP